MSTLQLDQHRNPVRWADTGTGCHIHLTREEQRGKDGCGISYVV